jgi:hypothetical protein
MSGSAPYNYSIVPVLTAQGYALIAAIDWSKQPSEIVFNFSQQSQTSQPMQYVGGAIIDNSQNANNVFVMGTGFQPLMEVLGGDIATIPIVAPQNPVLTLQQGIAPTPTNVGLTIITFTSWGLNLTKTTQFTRPYPTSQGVTILSGTVGAGDLVTLWTTSQAQKMFAVWCSGGGAGGLLLARLANLASPPSMLDSIPLVPVGSAGVGKFILTSGDFGGVLPSGDMCLGAFGATMDYVAWFK